VEVRNAQGSPDLRGSPLPSTGVPLRVFVAYSHRDERLREKLENHLSSLRRQGLLFIWSDREMEAGSDFSREIAHQLATADLVLLLVSADFIASDYCWGNEMSQAIARHSRGEATVIPVIVRPCDWRSTPFGHLVALPKDGRPVASSRWPNADCAFENIVEGVRKIISMRSIRKAS
jgi:hypothetical protein